MKSRWLASFALVAFVIGTGTSSLVLIRAATQGSSVGSYPVFEVDTTFPKLPNNWVLGNVAKVSVDRHDNVWIIHRPRTVPEGKSAAPPVVEWDAKGKFIQAWGGDGQGYDWPDAEHNVFVDYKDNVWISGSSPSGQSKTTRSDDMILKFTNKGKFLKELGGRSVNLGSTDPKSVNKPGDLFVYPKTNELFIADGYGNRRVIVFDAETLEFKRMWGAFGKPPVDDAGSGGRGPSGGPLSTGEGGGAARGGGGQGRGAAPVLDTEGDGPPTFSSPVHGMMVSNDGMVYVADRSNRRLQVFMPDGNYLTQMFVNRAGPSSGSVSGLAFSTDKAQEFLYLPDFGNSHIVVVDRKKLKVLYQFGKRSSAPGDFQGVHHLAVDSKGNLYAVEVAPGARVQRFTFKGMSADLPANALKPEELSAKQ
jgi:DNA-binding beta-propeller fold protein YncE